MSAPGWVRGPARASYDPDTVRQILDDTYVCHVATVVSGRPVSIPTAHWRVGDRLLVHGSTKNRVLSVVAEGTQACITAMEMDGLVLARSAFHHSMNYRSVILYGTGTVVSEEREKRQLFDAFVEKMKEGRSNEARRPNDKELKATILIAFPLSEASAKCRTGGPIDDPEDMEIPVWAGVIPIERRRGKPILDEPLKESPR